jgi:hypothetical protein
VRARWLFCFVLLVYLLGPSRPVPEGFETTFAGWLASPVFAAMAWIYPRADPIDVGLRAARVFGATCTAGAVALIFATLRRRVTETNALALSLVSAFASPLWSGASRSVVPEAPAALFVATAVFLLPSAFASVANSRSGPRLVVGGFGVLSCVCAFAVVWPGRMGEFQPEVVAAALASPGKGLLFFAPLCLAPLAAFRSAPCRIASAIVVVVILGSAFSERPWGEPSFGPARFAPLLPLIAWGSASAFDVAPKLLRGIMSASALAAVFHALAVFGGGRLWDARRDLVRDPAAVWDFRDSPFSDVLAGPPPPALDGERISPASLALREGVTSLRAGAPAPWFVHGFAPVEAEGVWATGRESWIAFSAPPGDYELTLIAAAPARAGRRQGLSVEGANPGRFDFKSQLWEYEPVVLRVRSRGEGEIAVVKMKHRHTWMPGHGDVRNCAFFVTELRLTRLARD